MSAAETVAPTSQPTPHEHLRFSDAGRSRFAAIRKALVAGMAASKEYRHLNGRTDRQLRQLGLTRSDIPRELYRRHFEGLGAFSKPAG